MFVTRKKETPIPYTCSRLNESTHVVVHNDEYSEFPFIYVKLYFDPLLVVVFDTGCGSRNADWKHGAADLKHFIEGEILSKDGNANSVSGTVNETAPMPDFLIICTHCHFDHIGGIASFAQAGASILASGYDRGFLSPENRPANSLCVAFGMETPEYHINYFAGDGERVRHRGVDLGMRVLHTPGHTPDSLAVYDERERWLFAGDTCYERIGTMPWGVKQDVPIVFPLQGNWLDYLASVRKLLAFVEREDRKGEAQVRMACGHTTTDAIAAELLGRVLEFSHRVAKGLVRVVAKLRGDEVAPGGSLGDETFVLWQDEGELEFSMCAPERFRLQFQLMDARS